MELIEIKDFKLMIEKATNKKLHSMTFARYRNAGLFPRIKKYAPKINIDVADSIIKILDYDSKSHSDKIKAGQERKRIGCGYNLAFNLMKVG